MYGIPESRDAAGAPEPAALRDAFDATVKDPEFIKAAAAARIEVNPIRGEALQSTVSKVLATPKHLVERARSIIAE